MILSIALQVSKFSGLTCILEGGVLRTGPAVAQGPLLRGTDLVLGGEDLDLCLCGSPTPRTRVVWLAVSVQVSPNFGPSVSENSPLIVTPSDALGLYKLALQFIQLREFLDLYEKVRSFQTQGQGF